MSPYIRTVKTASGATAVQVVYSSKHGARSLQHIGSAHTDVELAALKTQAKQVLEADQISLDLSIAATSASSGTSDSPVPITSERAGYLIDSINSAHAQLGFDTVSGSDEIFRNLVLARIIQPGSKLDSIETLAEVGVSSASYPTIIRHLPRYATDDFRQRLTRACAAHAQIGPGTLVLYDVTTLYFETDAADEFRKPGFSKERRLEPQITVGLLSDASGFPLSVAACEGNMAETRTMLPMIDSFRKDFNINDVTIVADAGMFSAANKQGIVDAGLGYILGTRFKDLPYVIDKWRKDNPGVDYEHGQIWATHNRAGCRPDDLPHDVTYYQYSHDRARRTLKGIEEQVAKAEKAVAGKIAVKRNRFVDLKAPHKQVNWVLVELGRFLAGIKSYQTNRVTLPPEQVIGSYRQLLKIEKAFRMSKSDLKARPIYHHKRESVEAHLSVVMSAMAVGHLLEQQSGLSLKRLVRTLRKYRSFEVNIGGQKVHAASPVPDDVAELIKRLKSLDGLAH